MLSSKRVCARCRSSITGCTSGSRHARRTNRQSIEEACREADAVMGAVMGDVRIEPMAGDDVEPIAALASEIWHDHYPAIIGIAQLEYMLKQRYDPAVMRAELGCADIWWDKLTAGGELCGFSSYLLMGDPSTMKLD